MRVVLALFATGLVTPVLAQAPVDSIEDFLAAEMPKSGAPGVAYAVVEEGVVKAAGAGQVTAHTLFPIGSISKSFTAMAVMKLSEAGKLELDAPVARYLEVFKGRPSGAITLRQLLSHTSGYSTLQGNDTDTGRTEDGDELRRQVERMAQWIPAHAPDAHWQYSNANYLILGAVIEAVSGMDYASYMQREILEPIGMQESFVPDGRIHDAMAVPHQPWFTSRRALERQPADRANAPAGGIVATASDLALYLAVMMNGRDDVISAANKAAMLRPASAASPYYGLGWSIDTQNGTFFHSGLVPGVETLAVLLPAKRKGVVILVSSNSGLGFGENGALFSGISARALGLDDHGSGGVWGRRSLYLMFAVLPVLFVAGMVLAVVRRTGLRAKSGAAGAFSLWFPLITTLALAWTCVSLIPRLFGVTLGKLYLYQPDFVVLLIATAATGVLWAVFRLGVFYGGRPALA